MARCLPDRLGASGRRPAMTKVATLISDKTHHACSSFSVRSRVEYMWEVPMRESGRESFETWARSRQQALVRTAYLLTGDFHRAEDLVQDALVKAATRWDDLADGNPDAWVRTVVYRDQVSWWRRHRREVLTT